MKKIAPMTPQQISGRHAHTVADLAANGGPIAGCWCSTCRPPVLERMEAHSVSEK